MSGHSKWSKVKHQKAVTDAVKGKAFTKLSYQIMLSVKEGGGGDPASNFKLRLAIDKAKAMNMPKDNIERAIDKGVSAGKEGGMMQAVFEGFGPGGVGIIIDTTTDNNKRTVSELKNILERHGGSLATTGAVSHGFSFVGYLSVSKEGKSFDDILLIALDAGAQDAVDSPEEVDIFTNHSDLHKIKEVLLKNGLKVGESELVYKPNLLISVDKSLTEKIEELLTLLEDRDDVQAVYANYTY
jgi:YebC/PmpR family DNA-binding regulatory protein